MIGVELEEIDQELSLKIVKVNADDNEEFISQYQVLGLPTLLFFREGKLVERVTGFQPKAMLIEALLKHGFVE